MGDDSRRRGGAADDAGDAAQAGGDEANPQIAAARSEGAIDGVSHSAAADHGAGDLNSHCPFCQEAGRKVLFRASDRLYATTEREFEVVECAGCGLMRMHPWPEKDELWRFYPKNYWFEAGESAAARMEERYRRFVLGDHVRFVRRALRESGEKALVVDVGCGGGLFLRLLSEEGWPVLGLDYSPEAAGIAWRRNGVRAAVAALTEAPVAEGSCAAVTMFHVLEHVYDPAEHLEAARKLLRPEGRLIVQVPNASCWQFLLLQEHWNGLDVPRHLIDFRQRDVEALLERTGFEVLNRKHFSLRDNPAGLATSLAPRLDPMARRLRGTEETPRERWRKDLLYFALVVAAVPFTVVEAACRAGSTIMIEARRKA